MNIISGHSKYDNDILMRFSEPNYIDQLKDCRDELYQLLIYPVPEISYIEQRKNLIAQYIILCGNILNQIDIETISSSTVLTNISLNYKLSIIELDTLEQSLCEIKVRKLYHNITNNLGLDESVWQVQKIIDQANYYQLNTNDIKSLQEYTNNQSKILNN